VRHSRFSRHGRAVQSSGCNLPLPLVCIAMIRSVRLENQVLCWRVGVFPFLGVPGALTTHTSALNPMSTADRKYWFGITRRNASEWLGMRTISTFPAELGKLSAPEEPTSCWNLCLAHPKCLLSKGVSRKVKGESHSRLTMKALPGPRLLKSRLALSTGSASSGLASRNTKAQDTEKHSPRQYKRAVISSAGTKRPEANSR
jgi:hypothetical protein